MKYYVWDIELDFSSQPNSDIYTASYPKEMDIEVSSDIVDVENYIKDYILDNIEVEFDTPDAPDFEIGYVDFAFEQVDVEIENDDPEVDLYVEQSQMERS